MLQRRSFATCLFSAVAVVLAPVAAAAEQPLAVMPAPSEVQLSEGRVAVSGVLTARATVAGSHDARLEAALYRAAKRWNARLGAAKGSATSLTIVCDAPGSKVPVLGEDESYSLSVSSSQIVLHAPTVLGAMHGLETLLQLPQHDGDSWYLPAVTIHDAPRFPWRSLMIDVSRHWQPTEVILRNIDLMAVVKLNVLHLHLTDDQGFRIESLTHPELQAKGSDGNFFTQAQMRSIISYAADRGIRVVPEFDVPGHATSWVVSHPELASLPGPYGIERHWGVFNPVLDPTNEATYALLEDFLGEMSRLFPDEFIHIGGDENNGVQWNANAKIQAYIREHDLGSNEGLHTYFNARIEKMLRKDGKRMIGWDEILHPGLPKTSVIESWRGAEALADAASQGYDGILANGYYIDLIHPASDHYLADPIPASSSLSSSEKAHILGGDSTMWSEWVGPETIDSRIWPRTAAIAERLWSPQSVTDVADMYRRLDLVSLRLDEAGSLHLKNQDAMLRHLVGENLDIPGIASLRTFLALVEPVKVYNRGRLQVWANQATPLVDLADAVQPESELSRILADDVKGMLFSGRSIDTARADSIAARFSAWQAARKEVAEKLVDAYPALREARVPLGSLAVACNAGTDAIQSLKYGKPMPPDALSAEMAALETATAADYSALEVPIVGAVKLLVAASALQDERAKLSDADWRAKVTSVAFPPTPPKAP